SELTRANANFGYTRFKILGTDRVSDFMLITLGVTRQLPPLVRNSSSTASLQVRHNERFSNQLGGDYRENAVIAFLNTSF
ncbi:MAG TPA: TIGR03016 family PEP-CTERM system-associated outer membrane protein, partial [Nitrosospira sp.]